MTAISILVLIGLITILFIVDKAALDTQRMYTFIITPGDEEKKMTIFQIKSISISEAMREYAWQNNTEYDEPVLVKEDEQDNISGEPMENVYCALSEGNQVTIIETVRA
jgi:hypothetical protein